MLYHMLSAHPDICAHGEVFTWDPSRIEGFVGLTNGGIIRQGKCPPLISRLIRKRNEHPDKFLADYVLDLGLEFKAVGAKIKFEELSLRRYKSLKEYVRRDKNIHIILLKRRNWLRRYVSAELSQRQYGSVYNVVHGQAMPEKGAVTIDAKEIEKERDSIYKRYDYFDKFFSNHPLLPLYYEDLVAQPLETIESVFQFLRVKSHPVEAKTIRLNPEPLSALIANFSELQARFDGSEIMELLEK